MNEFLDNLLVRIRPLARFIVRIFPVIAMAILATVLVLIVLTSMHATPQVLDAQGVIASAQKDTLILATAIMMIIILPVFLLAFFIAFRYRESNKRATYAPEWASSKRLEFIWWGVPILVVMALSVITYKTSHELDPYKSIESDKPTVQVQVIALQWKWLFLYPNNNVASVNEVALPIDTPVEFTITSDAPMNSFWIPQLGGQIYAMSGMSTKLHLAASKVGDYRGVSANLSGKGHSDMNFTAKALSEADYNTWLHTAQNSKNTLDAATYEELRLPSLHNKASTYHLMTSSLYDEVIDRYSGGHSMEGMSH